MTGDMKKAFAWGIGLVAGFAVASFILRKL
jgi:hypothetical protein